VSLVAGLGKPGPATSTGGTMDFKSITRVVHLPTKNPFACIFKEATEEETANPDAIVGIRVELDEAGQVRSYIICATDEEKLIFSVNRECPDVEKERHGVKPKKQDIDKEGIIDEEFDRAWSCSALEDVPEEVMKKIDKALEKEL
jgi:hypothetical protein